MHKINKNNRTKRAKIKRGKTKRIYKKTGGNNEDDICSICQSDLGPDPNILYKHTCNNSFHISCILKWCEPNLEERMEEYIEDRDTVDVFDLEDETISVDCNCPMCRQPINELPFTYEMYSIFLQDTLNEVTNLANLANRFSEERIKNKNISKNYEDLYNKYKSENTKHIDLSKKYNGLVAEYNTLVKKYNSLL